MQGQPRMHESLCLKYVWNGIHIYVEVKIMNRINPEKGEWKGEEIYQVYGTEEAIFRVLLANVF